jgi:hypothetical protein
MFFAYSFNPSVPLSMQLTLFSFREQKAAAAAFLQGKKSMRLAAESGEVDVVAARAGVGEDVDQVENSW